MWLLTGNLLYSVPARKTLSTLFSSVTVSAKWWIDNNSTLDHHHLSCALLIGNYYYKTFPSPSAVRLPILEHHHRQSSLLALPFQLNSNYHHELEKVKRYRESVLFPIEFTCQLNQSQVLSWSTGLWVHLLIHSVEITRSVRLKSSSISRLFTE